MSPEGGEVAGAVEAGARGAVGVGDEALGGEGGPAEVELAAAAHGSRGQRAVQHVRPGVPADVQSLDFPVDGTVLVTGGTGGLGRVVARHLVVEHGVRDLLLVSRSGRSAEGVAGLTAELVSRYEVRAVVHTAGVLDDGMVESLTPERLAKVLRPKVDAAWNLHRATEGLDLDAFVVFSSVAGTFGSAGQGAYAAGNAFLDGLVAYRRGLGLSGVSLVWGPWSQDAGMTEALSETDRRRIARSGLPAVTAEEGVALFDAALVSGEPVVLPVHLDLAALRAQGEIPPLLSGLIRTPVRRAAAGAGAATATGLAARLAGLGETERRETMLDLVRGQIAVVLGHSGAQIVDPNRAFRDLGFDSLTAVELRNRLGTATGLRLPATVVFDYPTAELLSGHLLDSVLGIEAATAIPVSALPSVADDPIVIVGMACRYPGGV
ncbi:KR domain-containing protein, partial [Streptomyces sp. P38-E01]